MTVARTDALDAVIALPEQRRYGVEVMAATATLWDGPDLPYALTLREISPDVDPASRTYTARFTIEAPDRGAQPWADADRPARGTEGATRRGHPPRRSDE